jgi:D-beta-D-heptose 7-phosphate kinase / D-beta-D-heptose 1-phosphate adenosyltransferase
VSDALDPTTRVLSRDEAIARFGRTRSDTVVFTNGCFDILHRGHVEYLHFARALGDRLIVGLNSDSSVRGLKGEGRPIVGQDDRAYVLAGLASVDAVTVFDEDTPAALIEALLPDVLVKGGDYTPDTIVGREAVEQAGGHVVIIPFVAGRSTTDIVHAIRNKGS